MAEALYSLSTVGGEVLWQGFDSAPSRPDIDHPILEHLQPLYFGAKELFSQAGLSVAAIRSRAIALAHQRPHTGLVAHPTVLEDVTMGQDEVSLWYFPDDVLELPELDSVYAGPLLDIARQRLPAKQVDPLPADQDRYCIFVTEVRPEGSRMDLHIDGRQSVIVNLSDPEHRGRTVLGHPDLLAHAGRLTVARLMEDPRTLIQRLYPGNGVAFDTRDIPHVGVSDPGPSGHRVVLDLDYRVVGEPIDLTVYDSYTSLD